ncbi:cysteine hydrolase family protein [Pseudonocardia halophobica]|uniref:cysteine hydrolase family protein n=1 Tax=Pseudonocardia halophobica TaxID=29401 RepID=UPI003D8A2681
MSTPASLFGGGEVPDDVDLNAEVDRLRELRRTRTRLGFGTRPALVVVDLQQAFTLSDERRAAPVLEANAALLAAVRAAGAPVVYTRTFVPSPEEADVRWGATQDLSQFLPGSPAAEIDDRITTEPGETVIDKPHASAFFRTGLHERLTELGVNTVLITGTSLSGCVRATAVDASAYQYRAVLVEDCSYDPRTFSREAALWDLADRYADVVSLAETLEYLAGLPRT